MPMAKMLLAVLGFALALSVAHTPAAFADAGELDSTFGDGGRVTTQVNLHRPWSQARVHLAKGPDGRIVVAGAGKLIRYLADGEIDHSFGDDGVVNIALPGKLRFALGDVAVDREGRAVLIGTAYAGATPRQRSARAIRGARRSFATVIRYGVDGELDPSFGSGGIVMTDFDLPSAQGQFAPTVGAGLGAVDAQDRIILIAGTVEPISECGGRSRSGRHDRLVARLTQAGALDTTFGRGGIERIRSLKSVASMAFDREGGTVLAGVAHDDCGNGPTLGLISLREETASGTRVSARTDPAPSPDRPRRSPSTRTTVSSCSANRSSCPVLTATKTSPRWCGCFQAAGSTRASGEDGSPTPSKAHWPSGAP